MIKKMHNQRVSTSTMCHDFTPACGAGKKKHIHALHLCHACRRVFAMGTFIRLGIVDGRLELRPGIRQNVCVCCSSHPIKTHPVPSLAGLDHRQQVVQLGIKTEFRTLFLHHNVWGGVGGGSFLELIMWRQRFNNNVNKITPVWYHFRKIINTVVVK